EINGHLATAYVTSGSNGIYTVAFQRFDKADITRLDQPSCVLRFPLRVGITCDAGHNEPVGDLEFPLSGTQRTEAVDDTVVVPAGTFSHCVRVKSELKGSTHVPGVPGESELEATIVEWYAPNVGLVKQIGWEVADPASIGWGTRTMELMSFKK
ncbi:MAG TPA: hypothetical protein VMT89_08155, partial [Candidatus Acidoferrales bacterium]|nr:hypothetical protein [Candidatus Acidoferrales bacterium]